MNYAQSAALALKLLTQFGQDVTRRSYTAGTSSPTTADTTRKGAIFDFRNGKTVERGTLIQVGDKQLYVDADDEINQQDHFIVGGVEYVIVSVGEVNPAGTRVLYDLHLRCG